MRNGSGHRAGKQASAERRGESRSCRGKIWVERGRGKADCSGGCVEGRWRIPASGGAGPASRREQMPKDAGAAWLITEERRDEERLKKRTFGRNAGAGE